MQNARVQRPILIRRRTFLAGALASLAAACGPQENPPSTTPGSSTPETGPIITTNLLDPKVTSIFKSSGVDALGLLDNRIPKVWAFDQVIEPTEVTIDPNTLRTVLNKVSLSPESLTLFDKAVLAQATDNVSTIFYSNNKNYPSTSKGQFLTYLWNPDQFSYPSSEVEDSIKSLTINLLEQYANALEGLGVIVWPQPSEYPLLQPDPNNGFFQYPFPTPTHYIGVLYRRDIKDNSVQTLLATTGIDLHALQSQLNELYANASNYPGPAPTLSLVFASEWERYLLAAGSFEAALAYLYRNNPQGVPSFGPIKQAHLRSVHIAAMMSGYQYNQSFAEVMKAMSLNALIPNPESQKYSGPVLEKALEIVLNRQPGTVLELDKASEEDYVRALDLIQGVNALISSHLASGNVNNIFARYVALKELTVNSLFKDRNLKGVAEFMLEQIGQPKVSKENNLLANFSSLSRNFSGIVSGLPQQPSQPAEKIIILPPAL